MPITIKPTQADLAIARAIARHTNAPAEEIAQAVTWGADEKILCAVALGWWLWCRQRGPAIRCDSDHLLLATLVVTAVPHFLKAVFNQKRSDRRTLQGHLNGVPFSGKPNDAFPSGHALHVGALASAASVLPTSQRNTVWAAGVGLVLTRIVLLAHWASDVLAGLVIGAGLERLIRPLTGYGRGKLRHPGIS